MEEDPLPSYILNGATDSNVAIDNFLELSSEIKYQKKIASDLKRPLNERIEAFEDIFDSEIGDTTLTRARNIERHVGFRQIYLKFEGCNPTGTQKDRIAFAQVMDALRRGFDSITMATCGNYGASIASAASIAGIKSIIYIPENYHTNRIEEMVKLDAEIIRVPGDYENAVFISREKAAQDEIYDANPGGANTNLQLRAYGEIANEIYDELRDAPAIVAIPVSNGTTLAGIFKGFLSLYRRGKTSCIPKILAGSSSRKNPIIQAFLKNNINCEDLNPEKIRETKINEPLINWHSIDGEHALSSIRQSNGWAFNTSDKNLVFYSKIIREYEGLNVLPASTAGLAALIEYHHQHSLLNDRYVAVLTGRKI